MASSPYRRPGWLARQRRDHPLVLVVAFLCAGLVLLTTAAVTNGFGLLDRPAKTTTPTVPDFNPHNETILKILAEITGSHANDFPSLQNAELCKPTTCPELPKYYAQYSPPEVGIYFWLNITNVGDSIVTVTAPVLGIGGGSETLFALQTYCCYSTMVQKYSELQTGTMTFDPAGNPTATIGLEGFVYLTTATIPENSAGGYTLYFNVTSN